MILDNNTACFGVKSVFLLACIVISSGNQAERGMREAARMQSNKYPRACQVITSDMYVDDCPSGEGSLEEAYKTADELTITGNSAS